MPSVKEVFELIDRQLKEDISRAEGIVAVYQFNLSGAEAGVYQVVLRPDTGFVVEGEQEPSDCTLSLDSEDFKKMAEGELNGTEAFMSGRLRIDGDMGLALRLQEVLAAYNSAKQA
ncbi:SCP2 sterol-binding domain-containing protein [Geobacillus proteiniphilus]|uniref:SCP2 sterol-binding domain-containing protein n=1 Tax=Geobacillus proteiniphilus TaxID=860353 RepID=A0ABY9MFP0_9BACL|nr:MULTISPECIES: SCP2 sterol-binding domain-containing protein [Geobacillus]OPX03607.1 sterol-binding protein [Geobacillus sp. LEMMY01]WMJ16861.1 SCP2 sterol-binding domain-containing protein [Geobacillus proteiniphilus]